MFKRTKDDCLNIKKACFKDVLIMTLVFVASLTLYRLPTTDKEQILLR